MTGKNFFRFANFRWVVVALSAMLSLCSLLLQPAYAQSSGSTDVTAPDVSVDQIKQGIAGETQVFTVTATDDIKLNSVTLFHRLAGDQVFVAIVMEPIAGTSIFTASVRTSATDPRDLEYYVQAEDFGGNKSLSGFAFDPLLRIIEVDGATAVAATTPIGATVSRNRRLMWGLLGVVTLGLIASQSGGSSSSGGTTTQIPVDITVNPL